MFQRLELQRAIDKSEETIGSVRLFEIIICAGFDGLDGDVERAVSSHQNYFDVGRVSFDVRDQIDSGSVCQTKIGDDKIDRSLFEDACRFRKTLSRQNLEAGFGENQRQ